MNLTLNPAFLPFKPDTLLTLIYTYHIPAKNQPWTLIPGLGPHTTTRQVQKFRTSPIPVTSGMIFLEKIWCQYQLVCSKVDSHPTLVWTMDFLGLDYNLYNLNNIGGHIAVWCHRWWGHRWPWCIALGIGF